MFSFVNNSDRENNITVIDDSCQLWPVRCRVISKLIVAVYVFSFIFCSFSFARRCTAKDGKSWRIVWWMLLEEGVIPVVLNGEQDGDVSAGCCVVIIFSLSFLAGLCGVHYCLSAMWLFCCTVVHLKRCSPALSVVEVDHWLSIIYYYNG